MQVVEAQYSADDDHAIRKSLKLVKQLRPRSDIVLLLPSERPDASVEAWLSSDRLGEECNSLLSHVASAGSSSSRTASDGARAAPDFPPMTVTEYKGKGAAAVREYKELIGGKLLRATRAFKFGVIDGRRKVEQGGASVSTSYKDDLDLVECLLGRDTEHIWLTNERMPSTLADVRRALAMGGTATGMTWMLPIIGALLDKDVPALLDRFRLTNADAVPWATETFLLPKLRTMLLALCYRRRGCASSTIDAWTLGTHEEERHRARLQSPNLYP